MTPERWRRIDELLQSALERAPGDRAAFLVDACGGDEPLHREVGSLLAAHERAGSVLELPLSQVAADVLGAEAPPSLAEGSRVGPYLVLGRLGAGGMGEVYRAHDPRIHRDVAIKVLPASFAYDPDRLRRFEEEARAAGALSHPNVLIVHDVGRHEGIPYLVAELLEGETLRARLARGPIPWRKAAEMAAAIADGLAAAHAKGIVHRDLKPENVFVTLDGRVKLLDFGLAKLREAGGALGAASTAKTMPGALLGTVGYMAPEQVAGRTADARSDLFALGCLLHEMASGERAFERATAAETMTAILNEEPPEVAGPADLQRLIGHCLEKDPEARFQSARDLAFDLRALLAAPPAPAERRAWPAGRLAMIGLTAAAAVAVGLLGWRLRGVRSGAAPPAEENGVRFALEPPEEARFAGAPIVSPDGRRLVSGLGIAGKRSLWLRPLGAAAGELLPGTDNVIPATVSWSLDGRWILFSDGTKLLRIDVESPGPPTVVVAANEGGWGTATNGEGVVLLGRDGAGIHRVSAHGGKPAPLLPLDTAYQEIAHAWPKFLPDGRHFLYYSRSRDPALHAICVASLDGKVRKRLLTSTSHAQYGSGHLLYVEKGVLVARPFGVERLELAGDPLPLAECGVAPYGNAAFSVSPGGVLAYRSKLVQDVELVWLDRAGKRLGSAGPPLGFRNYELSPDGTRVVLDRLEHGNMDIWTLALSDGRLTRLTFDGEIDHFPTWSPDGRRIVFDSHRGGRGDLYVLDADQAGAERLLLRWNVPANESAGAGGWSPDGKFISFNSNTAEGGTDVWILPLEGDRKPFPFVHTPARESAGPFSPNGRWLAYASDESGRLEVYVRAFDGTPGGGHGKWQVSNGGGGHHAWRRDGKELFYIASNGNLMAVDVRTEGTFEAATPRVLFASPTPLGGVGAPFAVAADGQRFLWRVPLPASASDPIDVFVNWPAGRSR